MRARTVLASLAMGAAAAFCLGSEASAAAERPVQHVAADITGELVTAGVFGALALGLGGGVVVITYRRRSHNDG